MKLTFKITAVLLSCIMLQGCVSSKQGAGTLIGGGVGGLLAAAAIGKGKGKYVAGAAGALVGMIAGNQIGKAMDENDKRIAELASQKALETAPSGNSVEWKNPDSGHSGNITPTQTFKNHEGKYCREYTEIINIDGQDEQAYGKACRQPDGHWEIVQ